MDGGVKQEGMGMHHVLHKLGIENCKECSG